MKCRRLAMFVGALSLLGCATPARRVEAVPQSEPPPRLKPRFLRAELLASHPHANAFTQGLLWHQGQLYESTGLVDALSSIRKVDLQTGEVLTRVEVPEPHFVEGLTLVGDRLLAVTEETQTAFLFDPVTLEKLGEQRYEGTAWGVCYDGTELFVTNGTDTLSVWDPRTLKQTRTLKVTLYGNDLQAREMNELECARGSVYANVWPTDYILRIDKQTGQVTEVIDATGLYPPEEARSGDRGLDVLMGIVMNGIAYREETDTFFLTGKYWPRVFEVKFVPKTAAPQP